MKPKITRARYTEHGIGRRTFIVDEKNLAFLFRLKAQWGVSLNLAINMCIENYRKMFRHISIDPDMVYYDIVRQNIWEVAEKTVKELNEKPMAVDKMTEAVASIFFTEFVKKAWSKKEIKQYMSYLKTVYPESEFKVKA